SNSADMTTQQSRQLTTPPLKKVNRKQIPTNSHLDSYALVFLTKYSHERSPTMDKFMFKYEDVEQQNVYSQRLVKTVNSMNTILFRWLDCKNIFDDTTELLPISLLFDSVQGTSNSHRETFFSENVLPLHFSTVVSKSVKTITFDDIENARDKDGDFVPNRYKGFNWKNVRYVDENWAKQTKKTAGFANAYTYGQIIAYNARGESISISVNYDYYQTFTLHSFIANSIEYDDFQLNITGYCSNVKLYKKTVTLSIDSPQLFQMNWSNIDKITFRPVSRQKLPSTYAYFALRCLNILNEN
ncbi:unnamed protein product, partial [Didymodactylos carnosus]